MYYKIAVYRNDLHGGSAVTSVPMYAPTLEKANEIIKQVKVASDYSHHRLFEVKEVSNDVPAKFSLPHIGILRRLFGSPTG